LAGSEIMIAKGPPGILKEMAKIVAVEHK